MLPNFGECWWDQWILDVLLSNGLGILLGTKIAEFFEMRQYNWSPIRELHTTRQRLTRALLQFSPESWTKIEWEPTNAIKKFICLNLLFWTIQTQELNAFFLKQLLWIAPSSPLNVYRLVIWFFLGCPSVRQALFYISDRKVKRIGMHAFLAICIMGTELIMIFKFGRGEFPTPMPPHIKQGAIVFAIAYSAFILLTMLRIRTRAPAKIDTSKERAGYERSRSSPIATSPIKNNFDMPSGIVSRRPYQQGDPVE